jgi:hypothetical protein
MLTLRRLIVERDGLLAARPQELPLLAYYANSIAHLREGGGEGPRADPRAASTAG